MIRALAGSGGGRGGIVVGVARPELRVLERVDGGVLHDVRGIVMIHAAVFDRFLKRNG